MDAVKFIMTKNRMCKENVACKGCPLSEHKFPCNFASINSSELKEMMEIVEQWGKENPQKTYKDDFIEKFLNAKCFNGVPLVRWCDIYNKGICEYKEERFRMCAECWDMEIEE